MKKYLINCCILILIFSRLFSENLPEEKPNSISDEEAMLIVQDQEKALEAARKAVESDLLADPEILQTTIIHTGEQKSVYNRLPAQVKTRRTVVNESKTENTKSVTAEMLATLANSKPLQNITLSGEVDADGISEIWWSVGDIQYRVFTNANFLYLTGAGSFEDEAYRYQPFLVVTPRPVRPDGAEDSESDAPWRPTLADFTAGTVEYYLVEPEIQSAPEGSTDAAASEPDETGELATVANTETADIEAGLEGFEAILRHYAGHSESLRITYENRLKIASAREAYLARNPREDNVEIINFRPLLASEKKAIRSEASAGDRQFTMEKSDGESDLQLQWSGVDAKYYFIEKCNDLRSGSWEIAPFAVKSIGQVEGAALNSNSESMFFRLIETEDPNAEYMIKDSDLDGISNGDELALGLDAFGGFIDANNDGVLDEWTEVVHEGTLQIDANLDGDLLTDREEFLIGGNPANFDQQCDGNLDYIYRDDLLAYWNFDEHEGNTIKDVSGNGHDFTLPSESRIYEHSREIFLRRKIEFKPYTNRYSDGEKIQTYCLRAAC